MAVVVGMVIFRVKNPITPLRERKRLAYAIGWAIVLPQMLAPLGTLFQKAGVESALATIIQRIVPAGSVLAGILACLLHRHCPSAHGNR